MQVFTGFQRIPGSHDDFLVTVKKPVVFQQDAFFGNQSLAVKNRISHVVVPPSCFWVHEANPASGLACFDIKRTPPGDKCQYFTGHKYQK